MSKIADNLTKVKKQIQIRAEQAHRPVEQIQLLAVSKTQPSSAIVEAFNAGQRDFGENYVQEALAKILELNNLPLIWHFIGPIQSNKCRAIAEAFHWVHSLDRTQVAQRLNDFRPEGLPPLQVCIQVNIDGDPNKSGCAPAEVEALANVIKTLPRLFLRGLMAIPKENSGIEPFHNLARLAEHLNTQGIKLDTLSMGMSADMDDAIQAGSTLVRIGTGIFGQRDTHTERNHPAGL